MSGIGRLAPRALLAALLLTASSIARASAQSTDPSGWKGQAQLNGTLFFGATEQRVVGSEGELSRADSSLEVSLNASFRYGEASDDGVRSVKSRSWIGTLTADARPFAVVSPFVIGSIGASFEQRVARRTSGGVGAKYTFARGPRWGASLSAAALAEQVRSLPSPTQQATSATVARWSLRAKGSRKWDRASISHVTTWQPQISDAANVLMRTTTQIAFPLSGSVAATLSLTDVYDSEARSRGARSNSDGQVLVGLAFGG